MTVRAVSAAFLIILFAGCAPREYVLYSESMQPTIANGEPMDTVLHKPRVADLGRYDLVVIKTPTEDGHTTLRRVIAFPGETVRFRDAIIYVNGTPLKLREEIGLDYQSIDTPEALYGIERDYVCPPGKVFVLGDNFLLAKDSRIYGPVPEELILAKVKKKQGR